MDPKLPGEEIARSCYTAGNHHRTRIATSNYSEWNVSPEMLSVKPHFIARKPQKAHAERVVVPPDPSMRNENLPGKEENDSLIFSSSWKKPKQTFPRELASLGNQAKEWTRGYAFRPRKNATQASVDCRHLETLARLELKDGSTLRVVTAARSQIMPVKPSQLPRTVASDTKMPFAMMVHKIITETQQVDPSIMKWEHDGAAFSASPKHPKMPSIMERYFPHNKFSSFHRRVRGGREYGKMFVHERFHRSLSKPEDFARVKPTPRVRISAKEKCHPAPSRPDLTIANPAAKSSSESVGSRKDPPGDWQGKETGDESDSFSVGTVKDGMDFNVIPENDASLSSWPSALPSANLNIESSAFTSQSKAMMLSSLNLDVGGTAKLSHSEMTCSGTNGEQVYVPESSSPLSNQVASPPRRIFRDISNHMLDETPLRLTPTSDVSMKDYANVPSERLVAMLGSQLISRSSQDWELSSPDTKESQKDSFQRFCPTPESRLVAAFAPNQWFHLQTPYCLEQRTLVNNFAADWSHENEYAMQLLVQRAATDFSPIVPNLNRHGESPFQKKGAPID